MIHGFDFGITTDGELLLEEETHDIVSKYNDELRLQLAYDRIKSVSENWFIDKIGANIEMLIGKPCNENYAEMGKNLIYNQLTKDSLWDQNEFYIKANIIDMIHLRYNILFKIIDNETEDISSYEIIADIDLIKGVKVRYGWEPKYDRIKYKNI